MIRDDDLDRILATWLAEGGERAPRRYVDAALGDIARTKQRPAWLPSLDRSAPGLGDQTRLLLVAALLAALAVGVAVGIGASLLRSSPPPLPQVEVVPSPVVVPAAEPVALVPFSAADWAVEVEIPTGWSALGDEISEFRHFGGDDPEGHLSITNENPYGTTVCSPDCHEFQVPTSIPYDATTQLAGLKASIGEIAGSDAWTDLPPGVIPDLEGGARVDTTAVAADGREWRLVYIVGLKARNVVAIAWSQPTEVYDESLLSSVLDGIVLGEAPVSGDGDLVAMADDEFSMPVPGFWGFVSQPALDDVALSGVRQYGDGEVFVSIGDVDGTIGWCDPDCREITDQTSFDALEATVRDGQTLEPSLATTLDGEPALSIAAGPGVTRRFVVSMHDGRPVILRIDPGTWDVAPGIIEEMIAGFAFTDVELPPVAETFTTADGLVELALPSGWQPFSGDDGLFLGRDHRMTVRVGDEDGTITTCDEPAAPWELCREVQATTLEELAAAVQPGPLDDHGVGPPEPRRDDGTLGGEPSVVTRIQAYEYPARSGQEVVYIVAIHDGRPYIVRMHTTDNEIVGLESVIAGFQFVD